MKNKKKQEEQRQREDKAFVNSLVQKGCNIAPREIPEIKTQYTPSFITTSIKIFK